MRFALNLYFMSIIVAVQQQEINEKIQEALCSLQCYDEVIPCSTYDHCDCNNDLIPTIASLNKTKYANSELRLKCKAENLFHVEWDDTLSPYLETSNQTVYFLHIVNPYKAFFTEIIYCNYYSIEDAFSNTSYNVTLWGVDDENNIFVSKPLSLRTSSGDIAPQAVSNISLSLKQDDEKYDAMVKWIPAEDLSCYYEIILYCTHTRNPYDTVPAPDTYDISDVSELFNLYIEDLKFGYSYALTIRARTGEFDNESTNTTIYVKIPTCLETFKNLTICEPEQPQNLSITEVISEKQQSTTSTLYDIYLNWSKPMFSPDYYLAKLNVINKNSNENSFRLANISGDSTNSTFKNVKLSSYYQVFIQAVSAGGESEPVTLNRFSIHPLHVPKPTEKKMDNLQLLLTILTTIAGVFTLGLLIIPIRRLRLKKETLNKINLDEKDEIAEEVNEDHNQHEKPTTDEWEISLDNLKFMTILGEGAFGIVWQASFRNHSVACKTLKDNSSTDEIRQLKQEIEIMKSVGSHPNIVSMVGCVTRNVSNGPILIVEYCSMGDLLTYLRAIYNKMAERLSEAQQNIIPKSSNDFTNKLYDLDVENEVSLSHIDVISFARQIAMGMEYLSVQKVLHRDLAARNILMCEGKKLKVSDFGLSRDVYMDSVYCKTTNGKLPIRWMALESLTHQIYTTQSDVWSFGILLWEIVSLGAIPYPGVETHDLLPVLRSGNRMEKPHLCTEEMYLIMKSCWNETPIERPTFSELRSTFEHFLTNETNYLELSSTT